MSVNPFDLAHRSVSALLFSMDISAIVQRSLLNIGALAKLAGVSRDYLKHLAKPTDPRPAGPEVRQRIARAYRQHAAQLLEDAALLDPPSSS